MTSIEISTKFNATNGTNFESVTAIIIPCYNEEKRLNADQFLNFLSSHPNVSFLFVNDGSTDDTLTLLEKIQSINPVQVRILDLEVNGGKAEAVRQGLVQLTNEDADYVGYWDADLATPLEAIEDFMRIAQRMPDLEVIFGARKSLLGHKISRKLSRRIVSRTCAILARFAINMPISDTQCGAKLFRNTHALKSASEARFTAGWLFDVELFSRLARKMPAAEGKFYEYPLSEWNEIPGSNIDLKAIVKSGIVMLKLIATMRLGLTRYETFA